MCRRESTTERAERERERLQSLSSFWVGQKEEEPGKKKGSKRGSLFSDGSSAVKSHPSKKGTPPFPFYLPYSPYTHTPHPFTAPSFRPLLSLPVIELAADGGQKERKGGGLSRVPIRTKMAPRPHPTPTSHKDKNIYKRSFLMKGLFS